jgi:hypothetical protein
MEGDMITTTECSNLRSSDSFLARLDLLYLYQIEYVTINTTASRSNNNNRTNSDKSSQSSSPANHISVAGNSNSSSGGAPHDEVVAPPPDLARIDRAVAMALVHTLTQCDAQHRPAYAIQISDPPPQEFTHGKEESGRVTIVESRDGLVGGSLSIPN